MAILDIRLYPDPVLRKSCKLLSQEELVSSTIQNLIEDMVETLYSHPGTVGITAPQVGMPVRLIVMDVTVKTDRNRFKVLINPVISYQSQWKYSREGCLSFPDYLVTVKRARKISSSWLSVQGNSCTDDFRDFEAIVLQHELDHLDGILFIDRVKNIQTDLLYRNQG